MFVCLCMGVTTREVARAVESGARTSKDVAAMCGAGSDCGRCRPTVRSIIASAGAHTVADSADNVTPMPTPICSRRAACANRIDTAVHAV